MRSVITGVLLTLLFVGTGCGGPPKGVVLNERMGEFCMVVLEFEIDYGVNVREAFHYRRLETPEVLLDLHDVLWSGLEACDAWTDWSEEHYPGGSPRDQY